MRQRMLAVTLALSASACFKVTYVNPQAVPNGMVAHDKGHFFLGGLIGEKLIPVYQMCPTGPARMQSKSTFVDLLLTGITLGIYVPRSYAIECAK